VNVFKHTTKSNLPPNSLQANVVKVRFHTRPSSGAIKSILLTAIKQAIYDCTVSLSWPIPAFYY